MKKQYLVKARQEIVYEKIIEDENQKPKRNYLIAGFSKNKAKPEFFLPFKDIIDFICTIRVAGEPNPEQAELVLEKILQSEIIESKAEDDLFDAINFLVNLDPENPCRIIICGSLYLARDVRNLWITKTMFWLFRYSYSLRWDLVLVVLPEKTIKFTAEEIKNGKKLIEILRETELCESGGESKRLIKKDFQWLFFSH